MLYRQLLQVIVPQRAEERFPLVATQQWPDVKAVLSAGVRPDRAVPQQTKKETERQKDIERGGETERHRATKGAERKGTTERKRGT